MDQLFRNPSLTMVSYFIWIYAMGECPAIFETQSDGDACEIQFHLTDQNLIVVQTTINSTDEMDLMLHTAARNVTLTEEAVRNATSIHFSGATKVRSWGGESESRFSSGNQVQMGKLTCNSIDVWEDLYSGKGTDGKFGLDLLGDRIIEINFDRCCITLHSSLPNDLSQYEHLKIENENGNLMVSAICWIDAKPYPHRFLVHSGYSGGILLDDMFATKSGIDGKITIVEKTSLKDSFGNTIQVNKGQLPQFTIGGLTIPQVPVGFFSGAIGQQNLSVIGSEVLCQFNLIIDLLHSDLYLSPRHR